jgi:pantothenate kinase
MIRHRAELFRKARSLAVTTDRRVILAIVGSPGSGKSTVTEMLLDGLRNEPPDGLGPDWVAHLPMDGYHLADVQLDRLGRRDRKGAADTFDAAGYVASLRRLTEHADETVYVPGFERDLEQPIAASISIPFAARLIITEGLYLLHDEGPWSAAAKYFEESWFCVVDPEVRVQRLVDRHVRFGKSPKQARTWVADVDEKNAQMVEAGRHLATESIDIDALSENV